MILNRALLSLVDDTKSVQLLQIEILDGETKSGVERVQNYGFTSVPRAGGEVVAVFINGNRDQGLVVAVDDSRVRLKNLPEGASAMYHYSGHKIVMTDDGIEVTGANDKPFNITAKNVNITLQSGGKFSVAGDNLTVDA